MSISSKTSVRGTGVLRRVFPALARSLLHAHLERQHHPRQLAAGSDLLQRLQGLPRIGRDSAIDQVPPVPSPVAFLFLRRDLHRKPRLHRQIVDVRFGKLFQLRGRSRALRG